MRGTARKFVFPIAVAIILVAGVCHGQQILTHHMLQVTQNGLARPMGRVMTGQTMNLTIALPLRNEDELDQFLTDVYDPQSANYRQFLTVEEFTERFGPTQAQYDAVEDFARQNGLAVTGTSPNRLNVQVAGSVARVEAAFHVQMGLYQHPTEPRMFFAPDREPTTNLSFPLWHVSGLDNFSLPHPAGLEKRPDSAQAKADATMGSGPSAAFLGSDMRAAYYGGTALTGAGQSLGLVEFYGTDLADLQTYYTNAHQTYPAGVVTLLSTDGTSTSCVHSAAGGNCDDTEQTLDMTAALGMAPGLTSLVVYVGSSDAAIFNAMATHNPLNAQLGSSWSWGVADTSTDDPYFKEFAAQGQNLFQATGDDAKWTATGAAAETYPADDAYLTAVGGTDLSTGSAAGAWSAETAWADGGGGISPNKIAIPSWQTAAAASCASCSQSYRNGPDVSANANFTFYVCADQTTCTANEYGGTSFAAPMWAGYMALVNQQAVANGKKPLGFINPTLYAIGASSSYVTDFHDVTSGSNGYSAGTGYDLATGWGSPNGSALINALAGSATTPSPSYGLSAAPSTVSVVAGSTGTSTITVAVSGGFNSAVTLTTSTLPAGVTASFSSSGKITGAGSSTLSFAVSASAVVGTYPITVTGTSGTTKQTTAVSLTVTPLPSYSLSAAPSAVSIVEGSAGSSTVTISTIGGFNSAVTLTTSTLPAGVTASFSPAGNISGAGSATLTFAVSASTATGTYLITVTGTSGTTKQTTTVNLTVTPLPSYSLSASPSAVSVVEGGTGSSTISVAVIGGFNSAVTLTTSTLPAGVTASFSSAGKITGAGSATLSIAVSTSAAPGTYAITVTGTSGTTNKTTTVNLTVPTPTYSLTAAPGALSVVEGSTGNSTITVAVGGGFNSAVTLTTSTLPAGVTASFSSSCKITGAGSATLTFAVSASTAPGIYPITVTGTSGATKQSTTVNLTVPTPTYSLSAAPSALSVVVGSTGNSTITVAVGGGFNSAVTLTTSTLPAGVTASFSSSGKITGAGSATLTFAVSASAAPGTYPITVTGTSGTAKQTAAVNLTVTPLPSYSLSATPSAVSVVAGSSGVSTITVSVGGGFNSAVTLTTSALPAGVTASFSSSGKITGAGSATLSFAVGASATPGTYAITVTGAAGTGTAGTTNETTTVNLTVTAPPPSYSLAAAPSAVSVVAGNSATSTITVAVSGGFNAAVTLTTSTLPAGVTASFSSSGKITGAGSATLTLAVSASAAAGVYPITVTGTSGTAKQTTIVNLTVTAVQANFALTISPSAGYLPQGQSGSGLVTATVSGGFNSAIAFSATGVPAGVTSSFTPATIAAPGSGTTYFNLSVSASAAPGPYTITITGKSGNLTRTTTLMFLIVP